jgi:hypothetical protein
VQVLDGKSGSLLYSIEDFGEELRALTGFASHDGEGVKRQRIVVGGMYGKISVYDPEAKCHLRDLSGFGEPIRGLACLIPSASAASSEPLVISVGRGRLMEDWLADWVHRLWLRAGREHTEGTQLLRYQSEEDHYGKHTHFLLSCLSPMTDACRWGTAGLRPSTRPRRGCAAEGSSTGSTPPHSCSTRNRCGGWLQGV